MDAEQLKQKIDGIRKTAVRLDNAVKENKKAKIAEQVKAKRKVLVEALQNDQESTLAEVISKGKILEKARLYLLDLDIKQTYNVDALTDAQRERLKDSFKTPKQQQVMNELGGIYNGIRDYTRFYVLLYRKMWEAKVAQLVQLCQMWEEADAMANTLTEIFYSKAQDVNRDPELELMEFAERFWSKRLRDNGIPPQVEKANSNGESHPKYRIVADIFVANGLYSKIRGYQRAALDNLELLRSAVEVLSDFVFSEIPLLTGGSIRPYSITLPLFTEGILDRPDQTMFLTEGTLKGYDKFFITSLKRRIDAGEEVPEEDVLRAVIPNYYNAEVLERNLRPAQDQLKKYLPDYYGKNSNMY